MVHPLIYPGSLPDRLGGEGHLLTYPRGDGNLLIYLGGNYFLSTYEDGDGLLTCLGGTER